MSGADRNVTLRRHLEQARHCVEEALSVVLREEDPKCAVDDCEQAVALLGNVILPRLKEQVAADEAQVRRREGIEDSPPARGMAIRLKGGT